MLKFIFWKYNSFSQFYAIFNKAWQFTVVKCLGRELVINIRLRQVSSNRQGCPHFGRLDKCELCLFLFKYVPMLGIWSKKKKKCFYK